MRFPNVSTSDESTGRWDVWNQRSSGNIHAQLVGYASNFNFLDRNKITQTLETCILNGEDYVKNNS